jgi:small subunit ribosomal protein S1
MSNPETQLSQNLPEAPHAATSAEPLVEPMDASELSGSFDQILRQFERSHTHTSADSNDPRQLTGTIVAITVDSVLVDIGYKTEGILPLALFTDAGETPAPGDTLLVTSRGRNPEGYYDLSRQKVAQPRDISALEAAFADQSIISGTVTALVKGGLTVDIGVRAFLPASRSGTRDAADLQNLVGQQISCRILKLEKEDEDSVDVVVDRRAVLEEEERVTKDRRFSELAEGDIVSGTVRSLTSYGAFVDLGGADGLLHISDMAWNRVATPSDIVAVGDQIDVKILKIDRPDAAPQPAKSDRRDHTTRRIALGLKQLQPHPWDSVPETYHVGDRITGPVTRLTDFGAFVELAPGIEGMIHISEMSWAKKVRKPEDLLKLGSTVDALILAIDTVNKRIGLGLKQTLGDPWAEAPAKFPVGSTVTGPVTSLTKFGAFMALSEGVEGLIHVSEMVDLSAPAKPAHHTDQSSDQRAKRIERPQDVLRLGQVIQALVLEIDPAKRQARLSMKQLVPTGLDEFLAEHQPGDQLTARILTIDPATNEARIELGDGIYATCTLPAAKPAEQPAPATTLDLSNLTSLLNAKWKGASSAPKSSPEAPQPGQIRTFRLATLNSETKQITVNLV